MSAALDPKGPSQPSLDQVYEVEGNSASKEPAQAAKAKENANSNAPKTYAIPSDPLALPIS